MLKKSLNNWFDEIFFSVWENFSFFHTVKSTLHSVEIKDNFATQILREINFVTFTVLRLLNVKIVILTL